MKKFIICLFLILLCMGCDDLLSIITTTTTTVSSTTTTTILLEQVAAPTISPGTGNYNAYLYITLSCESPGVSMRYTTDGSTPSETHGNIYTNPVGVSKTLTFRAIAYKDGYSKSDVVSAMYAISGTCTNPVFSQTSGIYNNPIEINISSEIPGATIKYYIEDKDTLESLINWKTYTSPFIIESSSKVYAKVENDGWTTSDTVSIDLTINGITGDLHCTLLRESDNAPCWVVLECDTENAVITTNFGQYFAPFLIKDSVVLEATAKRGDFLPSNTITQNITINKKPIISFIPMTDITGKTIITTLDDTQPMIIYTIDGTTPTISNGTLFVEPFIVLENTTIKAIAIYNSLPSSVETAIYDETLIAQQPITVYIPFGSSGDRKVSISNYSAGYYVKYDHQRYLAGPPDVNSMDGTLFEIPFTNAKYDTYSFVGYKSGYIENSTKD